jgi:hypothetical protein
MNFSKALRAWSKLASVVDRVSFDRSSASHQMRTNAPV